MGWIEPDHSLSNTTYLHALAYLRQRELEQLRDLSSYGVGWGGVGAKGVVPLMVLVLLYVNLCPDGTRDITHGKRETHMMGSRPGAVSAENTDLPVRNP